MDTVIDVGIYVVIGTVITQGVVFFSPKVGWTRLRVSLLAGAATVATGLVVLGVKVWVIGG